MYRDHPDNILGVNSADNQFESDLVASNADGSMLERLEHLRSLIAALTSGAIILQDAAPGGTNSTTIVVLDGLSGYGDDFFNNQFYLQILHNDNSAGNAPEKQTRKITDYTSATGSFTTDAFSAAIEANDLCLILHESQVAIGSDNANNVYDSSTVAANSDGSVLERLEDIKDRLDAVDNYVDTEVAAIKAVADAIPDAGALTTLSNKLDTVDNFLDDASLEKISGEADGGTHVYPDSVAQDSQLAYILSKADPAVRTSYNNTTDSLEALSDKLDVIDDFIDTEVAAIQTAVDNFAAAGGDGKAVVRKTVTFANTVVDVNLFTITAGVNFKLYAFVITNVESAAGCNIGVDLGTTVVIADTDCTTLEANDIWHDATPDASVELESVHEKYTAYGGTILIDVEGAKQVDSGVIVFVCVYAPITADGAVAAV